MLQYLSVNIRHSNTVQTFFTILIKLSVNILHSETGVSMIFHLESYFFSGKSSGLAPELYIIKLLMLFGSLPDDINLASLHCGQCRPVRFRRNSGTAACINAYINLGENRF